MQLEDMKHLFVDFTRNVIYYKNKSCIESVDIDKNKLFSLISLNSAKDLFMYYIKVCYSRISTPYWQFAKVNLQELLMYYSEEELNLYCPLFYRRLQLEIALMKTLTDFCTKGTDFNDWTKSCLTNLRNTHYFCKYQEKNFALVIRKDWLLNYKGDFYV